jgi:hypothetical protein
MNMTQQIKRNMEKEAMVEKENENLWSKNSFLAINYSKRRKGNRSSGDLLADW